MTSAEAQTLIDGHLLGDTKNREAVFAKLATFHSDIEAATPITRAIALLGARAADESLMALRLILSSRPVSDDAVRAVRTAVAEARKNLPGARERYLAAVGA